MDDRRRYLSLGRRYLAMINRSKGKQRAGLIAALGFLLAKYGGFKPFDLSESKLILGEESVN